jgi:hypothetical protein
MKRAGIYLLTFVFCVVAVSAWALDPPVIALERVDVATVQEFFLKPRVGFKDEKETGKDLTVGAILNLAYILNIKNPNKEPVMLEDLTFTTAFEGFEVNTAMVTEPAWIPAGKTNQLKVVVTNEAWPTMLSLMVGTENSTKLQKMGVKPPEMLKKWWTEIGDFSFPITVSGAAKFKDEKGKEVQSKIEGKWGGEKK